MKRSFTFPIARALGAIVAAATLAACAQDSPVAPGRSAAALAAADADRAPELGACAKLGVPDGSRLAFRAYARGVQIYRWDGASWAFVAPDATLYADAGFQGVVGTHYAGPTWESSAGGTVKAAVVDRCTADAGSIPWLLLGATSNEGPGIFARTTFIQRVDTQGGTAPSAPGSVVGEEARVPYTAVYLFHEAR